MKTQTLIFVLTAALLIPSAYASLSMNDACAAIRSPKFDSGNCTPIKDNKKTCCWYEKSYPEQFGRGDKVCQTCTYYHDSKGEPYEKCTEPKKQTIQLPPSSSLQDLPQLQTTDNKTTSTDQNDDNDTSTLTIPKKLMKNDAPTIGKID